MADCQPDFDQLLKVLRREVPDRPVLYEIGLGGALDFEPAKRRIDLPECWDPVPDNPYLDRIWAAVGFDYRQLRVPGFGFPRPERHKGASISLNEGSLISDRASFKAYEWPDPGAARYDELDRATPPAGMKYIVWGPGGVLENMTAIVGFDRMCMLTVDDPGLLEDISTEVGSRLLCYYEAAARCRTVGALMVNDDWGFKTQTMLSPRDMRRYVIPWHARITEAIHAAGKPAILHSCGNLEAVMDDVIDVCRYDAKHSWEDSILPVEQAYECYGERIAVMGGIDVDFLGRARPEAVYERSCAMLRRAADRGGYALGSGNSLPNYIPAENAGAMFRAALELR